MYETLIGGEHNALRTLARYQFSTWMDDIWDRSMYMKDTIDYWEGWQDLCFTIASDIEIDKRMKKNKAMIENGSHEAITLLNERFYRYFDWVCQVDFSWVLFIGEELSRDGSFFVRKISMLLGDMLKFL